jgi:hypothetical protein
MIIRIQALSDNIQKVTEKFSSFGNDVNRVALAVGYINDTKSDDL